MCIAIVKPAKIKIPEETLEICFHNNPDGAGFCYYNEHGKLVIQKGYFSFRKFIKAYKKSPEDVRMMIHFRIKTVGEKHPKNCHPWSIGSNSAMVHNGTVTSIKAEEGLSDSGTLARWMNSIHSKNPGCLLDDSGTKLIESLIKPSRVAIMTPMKFIVLNKDEWKEHEGALYSNDGFKAKKDRSSGSNSYWSSHGGTSWNARPPLDFTKNWVLADQLQGVSISGGGEPPPVSIYSFWNQLPIRFRELLVAARSVAKRPRGIMTLEKANNLFHVDGTNLYRLSEGQHKATRETLTAWLKVFATESTDTKTHDLQKQAIEKLSTTDLLVGMAMFAQATCSLKDGEVYTVSECLSDLAGMGEAEKAERYIENSKSNDPPKVETKTQETPPSPMLPSIYNGMAK